jgi:hypothetical protein
VEIETKGVCITAMKLAKVTNHTLCDIVFGDSEGFCSVISRQRTVLREPCGAPISFLTILKDSGE